MRPLTIAKKMNQLMSHPTVFADRKSQRLIRHFYFISFRAFFSYSNSFIESCVESQLNEFPWTDEMFLDRDQMYLNNVQVERSVFRSRFFIILFLHI